MRLHIANTYVEGKRYTMVVMSQEHAQTLVEGQAVAFNWDPGGGIAPGRVVLVATEDTEKTRAEMEPFMNAVLNSLIEREDELAAMS